MLRLEAASKTFRSGPDTIEAVRKTSLTLAKGDFMTIIGSNGAGKSTLLNLIAGTVPLTTGKVLIGGDDVTSVPAYKRARRIGRIVQNPLAGTAPSMTVAENLALAQKRGRRALRPALTRRARRELRDRLAGLAIGLDQRLDCAVALLSGGERQALTVAMATLARPEILLLDEHTAALDPRNAEMINKLTGDFVAQLGLTTLMVTHNMEHAIEIGNRLIMMHKGEVITELLGEEKRGVSVQDLVKLFSLRHVADDELLLPADSACAP
jgi:putative tryptophan/tyrosine transport system ATP-binding protein